MAEKLHRLTCPGCGAPISKEELRSGYVCRFCGSEFYSDENPKEENFTSPVYKEDHWKPSATNIPKSQISTKLMLIVIALAALGVIGFFVIMGLSLTPDKSQTQTAKGSNAPVMLSSIPKAEIAGKEIAYKGLEYLFDPNISVNEDSLQFHFTIMNWNEDPYLLRYKPKSLVVYDDLGNTYPLVLGQCDIDLPYLDRQIEIKAKEEMTFASSRSWCSRGNYLPAFSGNIPLDAKKIYLHLENFGDLNDITIVFDL
jgi:hypothetical protein